MGMNVIMRMALMISETLEIWLFQSYKHVP